MKIKLLLLLIFLFSRTSVFSQKINWQELDKTVKERVLLAPVDYGEFTTFEITGINKFLYKVTISGHRIEMETPIPTELQALFRLTPEELEGTANSKNIQTAIATVATKRAEMRALRTKSDEEYSVALDSLIYRCGKYLTQANAISVNTFELKLLRKRLIIAAQKDISSEEMTLAVNEISSGKIPDPTINYKNLLEAYKEVYTAYEKASVLEPDAKKGQIKKIFDKIETAFKAIDEEHILSLYEDVSYLKSELLNPKNFTITAPPVQADADYVNYEVKIVPSYTNTLGAYKNPISFDFDVPVKGGWKVDFSVGPVFSFGDNSKDDKYYLETSTITPDNSILRKRENNNLLTPGVAAMMHFYKRGEDNFSWGGLFGVGAGFQTIEDADVSFYGGASLILGKSQKIMINGGISVLGVERLKDPQFKEGNEYVTSTANLSDMTEKVFKGSLFLSVSYSLAKRVKRVN